MGGYIPIIICLTFPSLTKSQGHRPSSEQAKGSASYCKSSSAHSSAADLTAKRRGVSFSLFFCICKYFVKQELENHFPITELMITR